MVAQGDYKSPGHLGSMAYAVRQMLEDYLGEYGLRPGDAIVCNDPGIGSGHLPDLYMVCPVFLDDALLGLRGQYRASHRHRRRGQRLARRSQGFSITTRKASASYLHQALCRGRTGAGFLFRMIEANVRVPEVIGDIRAQYVANISAARRAARPGAAALVPTSLRLRWRS